MFIYVWGLILGLLCLSPRAHAFEVNGHDFPIQWNLDLGRPTINFAFDTTELPQGVFLDCMVMTARVQDDGSVRVMKRTSVPLSSKNTPMEREYFTGRDFTQSPGDTTLTTKIAGLEQVGNRPIVIGYCQSNSETVPDLQFIHVLPMGRTYLSVSLFSREASTWKTVMIDVRDNIRRTAFTDRSAFDANPTNSALYVRVADKRPEHVKANAPLTECHIFSVYIKPEDLTKAVFGTSTELTPTKEDPHTYDGVLEPAQLDPKTAGYTRIIRVDVPGQREPAMPGRNASIGCKTGDDGRAWMPSRLGGNYRPDEPFTTGVFNWECEITQRSDGPGTDSYAHLFCNRWNTAEESLIDNWWDPNAKHPNAP